MSRLVARIMLAILIFPLAALLYLISAVVGMEMARNLFGGWGRDHESAVFVLAGLVTSAFMCCYWLLLWARSVRWSSRRVWLTVVATAGALFTGAAVGFPLIWLMGRGDAGFGVFVGTVTAPLLWLLATVLIWRETAAERRERLDTIREALVCPTCGYNLTGLTSTRCPECGSTFTLDALVAGQPSRAAVDLEALTSCPRTSHDLSLSRPYNTPP